MNFKIYILTIGLAALSACSDFLDETPKGNYIPESIDDFGMMLDDYQGEGNGKNRIGYGQSNTITMTDDIKIPDNIVSQFRNWGLNAFMWKDYPYESSEHDNDYETFYHVIYIANYIIEHISEASAGTQFTRAEIEGAAFFHRANAYLNLVNLYAKHYETSTADKEPGVPLMLSADPNLVLSRSSVKIVYEQIIEDAEKALRLLPQEVKYKFRPNLAAANALLARTYLYMGNYKFSAQYADEAIKLTGTPIDYNTISILNINPDFGFNNFPTYQERYAYPDVIHYKYFNDANYNYYTMLSDELVALFDTQYDLRFTLFVTPLTFFGMTTDPNGYHLAYMADINRGYSIGEVYLTGAEAKVHIGDKPGARNLLNLLLEKRFVIGHFNPITEDNDEKLLDIILNERRKELMFKGLRWFDLKRMNKEPRYRKTITHTFKGATYTLTPDDNQYVLPIPLNVIEINPKLEQNPR